MCYLDLSLIPSGTISHYRKKLDFYCKFLLPSFTYIHFSSSSSLIFLFSFNSYSDLRNNSLSHVQGNLTPPENVTLRCSVVVSVPWLAFFIISVLNQLNAYSGKFDSSPGLVVIRSARMEAYQTQTYSVSP